MSEIERWARGIGCLNRTSVGLKQRESYGPDGWRVGLNRTSVGLKLTLGSLSSWT